VTKYNVKITLSFILGIQCLGLHAEGLQSVKTKYFDEKSFQQDSEAEFLKGLADELNREDRDDAFENGISKDLTSTINLANNQTSTKNSSNNFDISREEKLRLARLRIYILWRHFEIPQDAVDTAFSRFIQNRDKVTNREKIFIHDLTKPRDVDRFYAIDMSYDPLVQDKIDMRDPNFQNILLQGKPRTPETMKGLPDPVKPYESRHGYGSKDPTDARYATKFGSVEGEGMTSLGAYITGGAGYFNTEKTRPKIDLIGIDPSTKNAVERNIYFHSGVKGNGEGWKSDDEINKGNSAGCIVVSEEDYKEYAEYLDKNQGALMLNWYNLEEQKRFREFEKDVLAKTDEFKWTIEDYYRARRNFKVAPDGKAHITLPPWLSPTQTSFISVDRLM